jgi:hypothetical protein
VFYSPDPVPELPDEFDAYDPPELSQIDDGPAVSRAGKTAGPGQELYLGGHGFESNGSVEFLVFGEGNGSTTETTVTPAEENDNRALTELPKSLPEWSMVLVYPTDDGTGRPAVLNRAEPWSALPRNPASGETVSVIGRNLSHDDGTESAWVYLKPKGEQTTGEWAAVQGVNPYKVDFTVPENLDPGTYEVWLHNGHGGQYGWCPLHAAYGGTTNITNHYIDVGAGTAWSDGTTIDVTEEGADPAAGTDDTEAIMSALQQANDADLGTVYFPGGTYSVSETIGPIESDVRLLGDGTDTTTIVGDPDGGPPDPVLRGPGDTIELRDVQFQLQPDDASTDNLNDKHVLYRTPDYPTGLDIADCGFQALRGRPLQLDGPKEVTMRGSELIGHECVIGSSTMARIHNCRFYGDKDSNVILHSIGNRSLIMTDCEGLNYTDEEGEYAVGRWFTITNYQRHENCYIGNCRTENLGPREGLGDQNQGEQIMFEFYETIGQQPITDAGSTSVSLAGSLDGDGDVGWYGTAVVVAGRGVGQYRQIESYDSDSGELTLYRPWDIQPDETSTVAVVQSVNRMVVYDNELDGRDRLWQTEEEVAASGITMFGNALDMVVDGNTMRKLQGGIATFSLPYGSDQTAGKQYFHQYRNNTFEQIRTPIEYRGNLGNEQATSGPSGLGWSIRNNAVDTAPERAVKFIEIPDGMSYRLLDLVTLENNTLRNLPRGVEIEGTNDSNGAVALLGNTIERGSADENGSVGVKIPSTDAVRMENNGITAFETAIETTADDSDGSTIGEGGTVTNSQSSASEWHSVALADDYSDPIVVLGPASHNGGQPTTIRGRNVSGSGFEYQLDEWEYLDDGHKSEDVGYLTVERGVHTVSGTTMEAGTVDTDEGWASVSFGASFSSTSVVVSTAMTDNGSDAVTSRQRNVSTDGFDVRVQEEARGNHVAETIHYVAVEPVNGSGIEVGTTGNTVDHIPTEIAYGGFDAPPAFLADMQTFDGGDAANLRHDNRLAGSVEVWVDEERSGDSETGHTDESVGYMAFAPGSLG